MAVPPKPISPGRPPPQTLERQVYNVATMRRLLVGLAMLASLAAPSLARSGSGHGGGGSPSASTNGSPLHRCTTCMRDAEGDIVRSDAAKREFERLHP